ncbi:MAG: ComEC/Rec2 family competence protein [Bacteroidota bacterium]|nr:ComEC/Rec2 family competence protein [Bacteroidota bacterium]
MSHFNRELAKIPFFRFLIPMIMGILIGFLFEVPPGIFLPWLMVAGIGIIMLLFVIFRFASFRYRWLFGVFVYILFLGLGLMVVQVRILKEQKNDILKNGHALIGDVLDAPVERNKSTKILMRVNGVKMEKEWKGADFKIVAYLEKDSLTAELYPGDQLLIRAGISDFQKAGNPWEFNYPRYMRDRGIYGTLYTTSDKWEKLDRESEFSIIIFSSGIRARLYNILAERLNGDELAICSALIFGERDYLSEEVKDSFSRAGVMHVMAVSGLHVGIIYLMLFYFLFFLDGFKYGKVFKSIIIILLLWLYAMITGLTPSVLRATVMFSFLVIGQNLGRNTNIYNSLALSAFVLLCLNPFYLRNVGFQLSYFAVTGIVFFYPKIYALLSSRFWLPNKIWMLFSLSVAAQLSTFPLVIYYFHQFPNLFFISNLFVIPIVSVLIYLGFITLLFSFSAFFLNVFSFLLNMVSSILIGGIDAVGNLKFSVSSPLFLDIPEVGILYLMLIFGGIFLVYRKNYQFLIFFMLLVIFPAYGLIRKIAVSETKSLVVFNSGKCSLIQFAEGNFVYVVSRYDSEENSTAIKYALDGFWNKMGIRNSKFHFLDQERTGTIEEGNLIIDRDFFSFCGEEGYFLDLSQFPSINEMEPFQTDLLILSGSGRVRAYEIQKLINPELVILDSSVPYYCSVKLKPDFQMLGIPCYNVREKGAFMLEKHGSNLE